MTDAPRATLLTRPFVLAFLSHLSHSMSFNLFLHLPGFLKEIGATEVDIGLLFGATAGTAIVARPVIGRSMDLWGRRPMFLAGGLVNTVVCALYLTVHRLGPAAYAVRLGHGVGEAMLFASLFAFAAEIVPASRRIEGIALFGVSGMLPLITSGLLGDLVVARFGYRAMFLLAASFSFAALLLSLPLRDPPRSTASEPSRGVLAALVQRDLLPLWFIGVVFAAVVNLPVAFLKTFVMESGVGSVGAFFSAYAVAAIALRLVLGGLPERVGPKRVLVPSLFAIALGLMLLASARGTAQVVAAGALCGGGHGYAFPIELGLVVARARPAERGAALSLFTALFDAGTLVGAPLWGALIGAAGYPAAFVSAAALVASGAAAFVVWDRPHGRRPATPT